MFSISWEHPPASALRRTHSYGNLSYNLFHSFMRVHSAPAPFTSHGNVCNYPEPKPTENHFPEYFGFSSSNCTVQDHIPTTAGDALMTIYFSTYFIQPPHPSWLDCNQNLGWDFKPLREWKRERKTSGVPSSSHL